MPSEIQGRVGFEAIRYAQCWEDAGLLVAALEPAGRRCLSIASAGDNALALLAAGASHVTAVDLSPAQCACVALRAAAILALDPPEFLGLLGVRPRADRAALYARCRGGLDPRWRGFWDARPDLVEAGVATAGRFERYFAAFRRWVLPLAHPRRRVRALLEPRTEKERREFWDREWNNRRWRMIFHVFFSRLVLGRFGRDPEFFRHVEGAVAPRILARTRHALVTLDPSRNPYLHWILTGTYGRDLPYALDPERHAALRRALQAGRLSIRCGAIEDALATGGEGPWDAFNLSDLPEYLSPAAVGALYVALLAAARPGARIAYWNLLVPRSRPEGFAARVRALDARAGELFAGDRAFFYSRFVLEEVAG